MYNRWLLMFSILLIPCMVLAQSPPEISLKTFQTHDAVPAGEALALMTQIEIPEDHHLTENFLEVRLSEVDGFSTGFQQTSSGEFEKGEVVRRGTALIKLPVDTSETLQPGQYNIKGFLTYQLCRDVQPETCYPPVDKPFTISLDILEPSAETVENSDGTALAARFDAAAVDGGASGDSTGDGARLEDRLKNALASGSILAYIIVFIAGFLTSLTPCVYPMIPITISYIGGRSTGQGKFKGFFLSLFYVLGLALIYAVLGVVAALTGSLFGSITQTPAVIGGVALLFGLMGLSMLGLFDIQLPASLQGRLQGGGPRSGFLGAVAMGAVAGLVAAPCAGPVVVALMTFIASTRAVLFGFTLMLAFAAGLGILFIVLGTFSGLLSALPSAGMWMDKVKKAFGVIMIGAAVYIAKPILPPPFFGILMGLGLLLLGAALGAFRSIAADDPRKKDLIRALALLLVFWGIYWVVVLIPVPGKIIPDQPVSAVSGESAGMEIWRSDLKQALKDAKSSEKMVILDFGAEWCRACKELEHKTFSDAGVIERLKEMIAVKVDCTKSRDPEVKAVQQEYGVTGLPTVIVLDSEGMEMNRFVSFLPPEQFLAFLDQTVASQAIPLE